MAHTAHKDPELVKELYDPPELLAQKIDQLVELIKTSKHFVVFTGAGISTSAGIPDFRGPEGVWTLKAQGRARTGRTTTTSSAVPTATHMSLVELQRRNICKYLISQNCDGLHRRSGIHPDKISELHGNGNIEFCETCGHRYLRDYHCTRVKPGPDHYTGRHCVVPKADGTPCAGRLMNSTIDFGQNLPVEPLELAEQNSKKADLHLVLGSSLTVSPACDMPRTTATYTKASKPVRGKLVIVNLQKTPLDNLATVRIYAKCDTVMQEVMRKLAIPIPPFHLTRRVVIDTQKPVGNTFEMLIRGLDPDDDRVPASIFRAVQVKLPDRFIVPCHTLEREPFQLVQKTYGPITEPSMAVTIRFHFMGHYKELPLDLVHVVDFSRSNVSSTTYTMQYAPMEGKWYLSNPQAFSSGAGSSSGPTSRVMSEVTNQNNSQSLFDTPAVANPAITSEVLGSKSSTPEIGSWSQTVVCVGKGIASDDSLLMITFGGSAKSTVNVIDLNGMMQRPVPGQQPPNAHWQVVSSGSDLPYVAKPRWGHTATVAPARNSHEVYLIGGWDNQCQYGDVHVYDAKTHSLAPVNTTGSPPHWRACHTTVAAGKALVVFGGSFCDGGPYKFFNDLFVFNTDDNSWKEHQTTGDVPSPRSQHAAVVLKDRYMVVIGGYDGAHVLNDVHVLDLDSLCWTKITTNGEGPKAVTDLQTSNFRVYPARCSAAVMHPMGASSHTYIMYYGLSGVLLLDPATWTWTTPATSQGVSPSGRHAMSLLTPTTALVMGDGSLRSMLLSVQ